MWLLLPACAGLGGPLQGVPGPGRDVGAARGMPARDATALPSSPVLVTPLDAEGLVALLANPSDRLRVVNFWASWCGPCTDELPMLDALSRERPDVDVVLVNLDHPSDGPWVAAFAGSIGLTLPVRHLSVDDSRAVLRAVVPGWPDLVPVTLVAEPGGRVRARFDGQVERAALDAALGTP